MISQVTSLPITTAVTCPTTRIHPAIIAQAAATAGLLTDGKFNRGVGTGDFGYLDQGLAGEPDQAVTCSRPCRAAMSAAARPEYQPSSSDTRAARS